MHELSVTESLLEIAQRHAAQAGARRVTDLYLVIGRLASIVDDSVQFYWDTISQGTVCEGAQLHFERVPGKLQCLSCGETYLLQQDLIPCPKCGSDQVKVLGGTEFQLESIGVET
jgi:hydrogenase nickel incorporation protein HypA/HybF